MNSGRRSLIKGVANLTCLAGLAGLLAITILDDGTDIYSEWDGNTEVS